MLEQRPLDGKIFLRHLVGQAHAIHGGGQISHRRDLAHNVGNRMASVRQAFGDRRGALRVTCQRLGRHVVQAHGIAVAGVDGGNDRAHEAGADDADGF